MEHGDDVDALSRQQKKRVYVSLYQTHVPELSDAGIVDYDPDAGTVAPTQRARSVAAYLAPPQPGGYPWHWHYLSLSATAIIAFVSLAAGVPGSAAVSPTARGGLVAVAFGLSAIA